MTPMNCAKTTYTTITGCCQESIAAVTGGRCRAGGPLQSLHETSRLTFEVIHAEHVEQTQRQQYRDQ